MFPSLRVIVFLSLIFTAHFVNAEPGDNNSPVPVSAVPASVAPVSLAGKIALAPILPSENFSFENRGGPLALLALPGFLINRNIEKSRVADLKQILHIQSFDLQKEMTAAILTELKGYKLDAVEENGIKYIPDDPRSIDYKASKIDSKEILSVTIFDIGLCSSQFSTKFLPRLNATFDLVDKTSEESVYSQSIYYGADARKNTEDQITSDPKYSYESFDTVLTKQAEVVEALREGIKKIAHLAAMQIQNAHK